MVRNAFLPHSIEAMKTIFFILSLFLIVPALSAQQHISQAMAERVNMHQDSAITRLIDDKIQGVEGGMQEVSGFRVQIYSSNSQQTAKVEAMNLEKKILGEEDLDIKVHVIYTPPFWKVRLGDFRTRDEANLLKEEIVRRFPELQGDTYIVRDRVTIRK